MSTKDMQTRIAEALTYLQAVPPPAHEEGAEVFLRMRAQRQELRKELGNCELGENLNPDVEVGADGTALTEMDLLGVECAGVLSVLASQVDLAKLLLASRQSRL